MTNPKHVAIIMDGNVRWGIKHKKSRNLGHKQGLKTVEKIIEASIEKKIKFLTLYTFSTENWKRPKIEINFLLELLNNYIDLELKNLCERNIKINIIGDIKKFPKKLRNKLNLLEKKTINNSLIQINIALNYGSRQEIINSFKRIIYKNIKITEKNISDHLYANKTPDPDLLVRTGDTKRLSNFLLWQMQYTEIFFEKKLWPDFNKKDYFKILRKFTKIKRNFGGI